MQMNKVNFKHREDVYNSNESDKQMSKNHLEWWIKEGINEGLGAHNIQDTIKKMFDADKIRQILVDSLTPQIIDKVSPYYKQEFYSSITGSKIVISPWWDEYWQEIEIVHLVQKSIDGFDDTDALLDLKKALISSIEIIDNILTEKDQDSKQ